MKVIAFWQNEKRQGNIKLGMRVWKEYFWHLMFSYVFNIVNQGQPQRPKWAIIIGYFVATANYVVFKWQKKVIKYTQSVWV